jgi:hypothetical protein
MPLKLSTALLIGLCLFTAVTLQAGSGGSGYSRYGIGDQQYALSGGQLGMGGAGLALISPLAIDAENPSAWTAINRVRISFSALYEGYRSADDKSSGYFAGMRFSGVMIAIPVVSSSGITFAAGVTPYSNINYNILMPTTLGGYNYDLQYLGEGGLSKGTLGLSARFGGTLSLGVKVNYFFGTLRHSVAQMFAGTPPQFTTASDIRSTHMNGLGTTFGMVYSGLKNLLHLPAGHSLNFGMVVSTVSWLTAQEEHYYEYTTTVTSYDTLISPDRKFRLPLSIGGGIAYQGDRWALATDLTTQPWSTASDDGIALPNVRDSYRWSLGGEFTPKTESSAPIFQRFTYRGGFFYHQTYYAINGTGINETGITAGCLMPVFTDSKLGIGLSYSFRGTTDQQMQSDHIFRLSLSLNVSETWFTKTPEE